MTTQTNLDLTDKKPTALMRLEAVVRELKHKHPNRSLWFDYALIKVLNEIERQKPSELADLKRSFCEGGIETESAETWSKKWGQTEQP
jgi:hypothetical protein